MSNYLSQEYKISAPQSPIDTALVGKTLSTLQNKYDVNSAMISQVISSYNTKLKGLRESDNEYIASKLKEVTSVIDQYKIKNGNLAYKSNVDSIMTAVTSVLDDPIVQDAVASAANKDAYDAGYQATLKKDPKLANSANYEYGKFAGGYQDYMQGKSKKLEVMQYTPYIDLTEENLKALKTIKDIKGKHFIERPDPNNPGRIIRDEIDGLEASEINKYLGSIMSAPQQQQMRINSWAKFGGNDIEKNRDSIVRQYDEYRTQKITNYEDERKLNQAIADNGSSDDNKKTKALRRVAELTEDINDIKAMDSKVLDTTTIASTLEKSNYLNGISQLAKAEWSTEYKKDEFHFANQALDLDKQKFELQKRQFGLEEQKFGLEAFKAGQLSGVDPMTGKQTTNGMVSQTPMSSDLAKTLAEEGTGQGSLKKQHDTAYDNVVNEAENFLKIGNESDINTLKADLSLRGIEVINGQYRFKNPADKATQSLPNTLYESFKKTGNTTPEMYKSNEVKKQTATELISVRKEAYSKVFNEKADYYVNRLKQEVRTAEIDGQSDLFEGHAEEALTKAKAAKDFVNRSGGWGALKTEMQKNPQKLNEFAEILNGLTSRFQVTPTVNLQRLVDLKTDTQGEIEKTIQNKTTKGIMMSAYNEFNLLNEKVKETVVGSISDDKVAGSGATEGYKFDSKQNITIRKAYDPETKEPTIYLHQRQQAGSGKRAHPVDLNYAVNKASSLYAELSKYVELGSPKNSNYIQATKDTKIDPMKVSIPSYATSPAGFKTIARKAGNSVPQEAFKLFKQTQIAPETLATKEVASETIMTKLASYGIPKDKAEIYKQKVLTNLPTYQIKTVVRPNPDSNFRNEFAIEIVDNTGKRISDGFLGDDKLSYELKYSMETYPQIYVLNQLLYSASLNKNNIDEEINKL